MRDHRRSTLRRCVALAVALSSWVSSLVVADEPPEVGFAEEPGKVQITIGGQPFATYVYDDPVITRPFFANVHAPGGIQVTRNHPPLSGQDRMDHPTLHPGIWMSFGDLNGCDYWRLKVRVVQDAFAEQPHGGAGTGTFAVRNRYLDPQDESSVVCSETNKFAILVRPAGFLLTWDTTFQSEHEFCFGDQEEMGLGFRVATPLRVEKKAEEGLPAGTGTILDSDSRRNEAEVWGHAADWCDYSGIIDGVPAGMTIFCHPANFRPSWLHVRDYGFLTANPFGRDAFHQGEKSKVVVKPGEEFRLQYGVLIHAGPLDSSQDHSLAYKDYLQLVRGNN